MNGIEHGGPDGAHVVVHDFSTNANPLGPPEAVTVAVQRADRLRYPDPDYAAVRAQLAAWHGVDTQRVLPTAGTSEAIRRLTLAARLQGVREVWVPRPGYGDYAFAAAALGMAVRDYDGAQSLLSGTARAADQAALVWLCEPNNPTGRSLPASFWTALLAAPGASRHVWALDRAYEPLRLRGGDPVPAACADRVWQCLSPNKALGMSGVRAGYLLSPREPAAGLYASLLQLAPSWVLSAEGVALLNAWVEPAVQAWLARCRDTLSGWALAQRGALHERGWMQDPAVVPFWLARPPEQGAALEQRLAQMRLAGIKLRDAASLGRPGWLRVSAQAPEAQQALTDTWRRAAEAAA
jgi:histidinol-phosphate aminotransferase